MVQRAKDAKTVGILAGTLGVADYLQVLAGLKKSCNLAGKKTYTFIMGKLNPAKLANFMEIDVFVLIACRENTLIESRDFYKPIVTPFEMEMACTSFFPALSFSLLSPPPLFWFLLVVLAQEWCCTTHDLLHTFVGHTGDQTHSFLTRAEHLLWFQIHLLFHSYSTFWARYDVTLPKAHEVQNGLVSMSWISEGCCPN
jgi:hypothetical protein